MAESFMPDWTARTSCLYPQFSLLSSPKWGNGPFGLKLLQFLLLLCQKKLQKIEVTLYSRVAPLHHCWYWNNIFKIKGSSILTIFGDIATSNFQNLLAIYHFKDDDRDAAKIANIAGSHILFIALHLVGLSWKVSKMKKVKHVCIKGELISNLCRKCLALQNKTKITSSQIMYYMHVTMIEI